MAIVIAAILVLISLATYHSGDPSLNTASGGPAENWLGTPGAWTADLLLALFGLPIGAVLLTALMIALRLWADVPVGRWRLIADDVTWRHRADGHDGRAGTRFGRALAARPAMAV